MELARGEVLMAETELHEGQIVEEGAEHAVATTDTGEAVSVTAQPSAGSPTRPRARRTTVKDVENRTGDLEQRVAALAEQVDELNRRIEELEASREQARTDDGVARNGGAPDLAEQVRQLDERLQKLANIVAQQPWAVDRG